MAKPKAQAGAPVPAITEHHVALARIHEREKTIRFVAISLCVTVGFVVMVWGVVRVLDKPPWLVALSVIVAALFGPSAVVWKVIQYRQRYVKKHHEKVVALERIADPRRESSDESTPGAGD